MPDLGLLSSVGTGQKPVFIIYLATNKNTGKVYVGKTCQKLSTRWAGHLSLARKGSPIYLYRSIRKHGPEAFDVKQIDHTESEQEANELEKLYIGIFNSWRPQYGYNQTMGGDGCKPNEETRLKMARINREITNRPEVKAKLSAANKGRKHTPEAIEKIRITSTGRSHVASEETRQKNRESTLKCWQNPEFREKCSAAKRGEKHPLFGTHRSNETKKKIGDAHRGSKNFWFGKTGPCNPSFGVKRSEEVCRKIGAAGIGKHSKPKSEETKTRMKAAQILRRQIERGGVPSLI